ncbi:uncharacterized protein N7473_012674 [Penicillium subrubescens]|uniref:uncharacterized protein n=1 Tax=Penicillium subrubescens TaxID=1316194 RepID=UPI002544D351|nr:uncharacterized protein N7473_012674 [Penicillium subrubescens]KAJ5875327.1 hypothetical protein N7473_012674 [Penicillium subrubescens]
MFTHSIPGHLQSANLNLSVGPMVAGLSCTIQWHIPAIHWLFKNLVTPDGPIFHPTVPREGPNTESFPVSGERNWRARTH